MRLIRFHFLSESDYKPLWEYNARYMVVVSFSIDIYMYMYDTLPTKTEFEGGACVYIVIPDIKATKFGSFYWNN